MKHIVTLISFFFFSSVIFAQLQGELIVSDSSGAITNAHVQVNITKGEGPYRYYWNRSNASIYQNELRNVMEGSAVSVLVVDANNDSLTLEAKVPITSSMERMESIMKPIVDFVAEELFFKPIYSKTIMVDSAIINTPFFDSKANFVLEKWLIEDGAKVEHEQPIAEIRRNDELIYLYAIGDGTLRHLVQPGDDLFLVGKLNNKLPKKIAYVKYDEERPFYNPNHTNKTTGVPLIVVWLVLGALFFTIKMRLINFRGVPHAFQLIRGSYDNPDDKGEVSHFQALVTALSGTVGLGNIAGVAVAISLGGAGATFWMIVAGLLGMASKFVECTLGVKYRTINEHGEVSGGPMYYLSRGLEKKNMKILGKVLAFSFAVLCIGASFGGGNMFQANQAFAQASGVPGLEWLKEYGVYFGLIMAILVGVVIIGGIKSIAKVTDKVVPFMVGVYVLSALTIIFMNITEIGDAFAQIIDGAFNAASIRGGVIGVLIVGFQRAAFSNEAGVGSASIAHSAAKTDEHVSEGIVALLEPFIDTVVVCTMTALVLIFTGYARDPQGLEGAELTTSAFAEGLGPWAIYVLAFAAVLFAFSTMISWSYYGLKAWTYLFGNTKNMENLYKLIFLIFVVIGSSIGLGSVLDFSDMMILGMAFPNILGLLIMSGEVRRDLVDYFDRVRSGVIQRFK
jgi:alanine or glycine:cation symporter, AGCS family